MIDIPDDDDPRITISIPIGEHTVKLPRLDWIDEEVLDQIQAEIEALDPDLEVRKAQRRAYLIQLRPFCDDDTFAYLEQRKLGQLRCIHEEWTAKSAMPLGEYLASSPSSAETSGRRSGRTSSNKGGEASTTAGD